MVKTIILQTIQSFNNREIALLIYLGLFFILALFIKTTRQNVFSLTKAICNRITFLMLVYVSLVLLSLYNYDVWQNKDIIKTIYISIPIAFTLMLDYKKVLSKNFLKNELFKIFSLILILEFIGNMYVFPLWLELIIPPVAIIFITILIRKNIDIKDDMVQTSLAIVGTLLLSYIGYKLATDFKNFATQEILYDFLFPVIFTAMFLPFAYILSLFLLYETLFKYRIDFFISNSQLAKHTKYKILCAFHCRLYKLKKWSDHIATTKINTKKDLFASIDAIKSRGTEEQRRKKDKEEEKKRKHQIKITKEIISYYISLLKFSGILGAIISYIFILTYSLEENINLSLSITKHPIELFILFCTMAIFSIITTVLISLPTFFRSMSSLPIHYFSFSHNIIKKISIYFFSFIPSLIIFSSTITNKHLQTTCVIASIVIAPLLVKLITREKSIRIYTLPLYNGLIFFWVILFLPIPLDWYTDIYPKGTELFSQEMYNIIYIISSSILFSFTLLLAQIDINKTLTHFINLLLLIAFMICFIVGAWQDNLKIVPHRLTRQSLKFFNAGGGTKIKLSLKNYCKDIEDFKDIIPNTEKDKNTILESIELKNILSIGDKYHVKYEKETETIYKTIEKIHVEHEKII